MGGGMDTAGDMKILLVEDERSTGERLRRQMQAFGVVDWVRTFSEASTFLAANTYGLVVTDSALPDKPGARSENVLSIAGMAKGARVYAITSAPSAALVDPLAEKSIRVFDKADLAPLIDAVRQMVGGDLLTREQAAAMITEAMVVRDRSFPDLVMTAIEEKAKEGVYKAVKAGVVLVATAMAVHYFGPIKAWAVGYAPWLSHLPWPR